MQKFILIMVLSLIGCSSGDIVYLCNGPHSEVYHKTSHCKGLRRCTTEIEAVDITKVKARHRRECKYCYH